MARMHPPHLPTGSIGTAEAVLFERLSRDFDDDWEIFASPLIRADGEEGSVEFVLVNPRLGMVLIGLVEDEAEASPDDARRAMRQMLREAGFEERFIGRLPIVAVLARLEHAADLRRRVAEAFAREAPLTIPGAAWAAFVAELLRPSASAAMLSVRPGTRIPPRDSIRLDAPSRDDAWRVYAEPAKVSAPMQAAMRLALDEGRIADSADSKRSYLLPAAVLALCTVIGILVGMAIMHRGGDVPPTQQASSRASL